MVTPNTLVQALPSAAQQASIGGILYQRMFEQVAGLRRCATNEHQTSMNQPIQRLG